MGTNHPASFSIRLQLPCAACTRRHFVRPIMSPTPRTAPSALPPRGDRLPNTPVLSLPLPLSNLHLRPCSDVTLARICSSKALAALPNPQPDAARRAFTTTRRAPAIQRQASSSNMNSTRTCEDVEVARPHRLDKTNVLPKIFQLCDQHISSPSSHRSPSTSHQRQQTKSPSSSKAQASINAP